MFISKVLTERFVLLAAAALLPAIGWGDELADYNDDVARYKSALESHSAQVRFYDNDVATFESDVERWSEGGTSLERSSAQWMKDREKHNAAAQRVNSAAETFETEARAYDNEVRRFNALRPEQRTQFQKDRLDRWHAELEKRSLELERLGAEINATKANLENRQAHLLAKGREATAVASRLEERATELDRRRGELNQRSQELDDWALKISRRAAGTPGQGVAVPKLVIKPNRMPDLRGVLNDRPRRDDPPQADGEPEPEEKPQTDQNDRPHLPGFHEKIFGQGDGQLAGGSFPDATSASGTIVINNVRYAWSARFDVDVTNEMNKLYRTQVWRFEIRDLEGGGEVGTGIAEIRGSATGAAGTAYANLNGLKIAFGVQFSGQNARLLTVRKRF